jgi:DNA polymerase III epsilon subunit-like protein
MKRLASLFVSFVLLAALAPAWSRADVADLAARRKASIASARELVHGLAAKGQLRSGKQGLNVRIRGLLVGEAPEVWAREPAQSSKKKGVPDSRDATYGNTHPMFKRLASSGWYRSGMIEKLQKLADSLRETRSISRSTPLAQTEFLVFDLEATGGSKGRFDGSKRRFLSGWDEITQFGYSIYRGGQKVSSGNFTIRPDVRIDPFVERLIGLNAAKLATSPRFEEVAERILTLMKGRVLVGQSAIKNDWSWLQSNFARLGVDLPGPGGLMLDTYNLSFLKFPEGTSLKNLVSHYGLERGHNHDAGYDATATAEVFHAQLRERGVQTLGDAFRLQDEANVIMHRPRLPVPPASAVQVAPAL